MNKEMRQATERELEDWPGVTFTEEAGKNHTKLIVSYNGQTRMVFVSATPSDVRAVPNHVSVLRREIRALGATRKHVIIGDKAKPVKIEKEEVMSEPTPKPNTAADKAGKILDLIGDLRYSEMLLFADYMRDIATTSNLRRGKTESWANMLHLAVQLR